MLNGASSAGKTSIARALQDLRPRPLVVTGIDTYIGAWPARFLNFPAADGAAATPSSGLRVVPGRGPAPSWILECGSDFLSLMRLAHRAWASIHDGGIDQVVDHVLFDELLRVDAIKVLDGAFWVGVTCEVDELVRREGVRGDRPIGFASGTSVVVHSGMRYDFVIDSTSATSEFLAGEILSAFDSHAN